MSTNANYHQTIATHQLHVSNNMKRIANELRRRGVRHDNSKFSGIEATIGGMYHDDYNKINVLCPHKSDVENYAEKTKAASTEHYKLNDHHVEHFENGLSDMNLIQLTELICDNVAHFKERGYAPTECVYEVGVLFKSHGASDDIISIMKNTVQYLCGE